MDREERERKLARFMEAISRGSTLAEAGATAAVARSTARRWVTSPAGLDALRAAVADPGVLRRRAYELALDGNVRLLIWLLEHPEHPAGEADSSRGPGVPARVIEVEIRGLDRQGTPNQAGPRSSETANAGSFIEFVDDDTDDDG
ncbi:MAG: hypothetical protein O3B84_03675 [Chloroflexi bacterium]|nr:hypothetical protein [Chloroflexota bacterium]